MPAVRIYTVEEARETILRRRPPAEEALPPAAARRIREVFGEELGAAEAVRRIIEAVRRDGDAAVRRFTELLDGYRPEALEVPQSSIQAACRELEPHLLESLKLAAERIRTFHARQTRTGWVEFAEGGIGQLVRPLDRVGVYVPGGRGRYPSTVLMTVVPARVAGVREVIVCTPPGPDGRVAPVVLAACAVAGADRVFKVGGAQAIAALAFGTESIPAVDKVVGPGGLFVTLAKQALYGQVGIDMLAGPSEAVAVADSSADPEVCAADLIAQAEHDPLATSILITDSPDLARAVQAAVERRLDDLPDAGAARSSLAARGGIVLVDNIEQALDLANEFGPEHLELALRDPWRFLGRVRNCGAVFLGEAAPHVAGDYVAGPSHVLPTGGTARWASGLRTEDFYKVISVVGIDRLTLERVGPAAVAIARAEGFEAHARSVEIRLKGGTP
jgi:histidinol dehydrogenase